MRSKGQGAAAAASSAAITCGGKGSIARPNDHPGRQMMRQNQIHGTEDGVVLSHSSLEKVGMGLTLAPITTDITFHTFPLPFHTTSGLARPQADALYYLCVKNFGCPRKVRLCNVHINCGMCFQTRLLVYGHWHQTMCCVLASCLCQDVPAYELLETWNRLSHEENRIF